MKYVRRRYLNINVVTEDGDRGDIPIALLREAVDISFKDLFGVTALARSSLKSWKTAPNTYIFSVDHRYVLELVSVLTLTKEIRGRKISLVVTRISTTLKGSSQRDTEEA